MADTSEGTVAVVSSLPRSGTHFLIDILRLNFREYGWRPPIWASAESLYYNLDRYRPGLPAWSRAATERTNFIVKTHRLPFEPALQEHLRDIAGDRRIVTVTPARPLADQMASYRRYSAPEVPADAIAQSPDNFYADGRSVAEIIAAFYEDAIGSNVIVDVVRSAKDPEPMLAAIADALQLERNPGPPRLPPRRQSSDRLGELKSRLAGRPSSELIVQTGGAKTTKEKVEITDPALIALDRKLAEASLL